MSERKKTEQKQSGGMMGSIATAMKRNKKLEILVYAVIVLLILVLYFSTFKKESGNAALQSLQQDTVGQADDAEERLSGVLSCIKGAGEVQVMITYETGPELITAMSVDTNTNKSETNGDGKESTVEQQTESRKPATVSGGGGTTPIILTERQPAVRGVIVVAEGAGNIAVKMDLQKAVQTVLDVPVQCIEVFELDRNTIYKQQERGESK